MYKSILSIALLLVEQVKSSNSDYELNAGQEYLESINANWLSVEDTAPQDAEMLAAFSQSFEMLERNQAISGCEKCKSRLALGKILALNRPDLTPKVFFEWCMRKGFGEVDCRIRFASKELAPESALRSSDFSNLLQLMRPFDLDGDWFCYYHDEECDIIPTIPDPEILMQSWYPQKPVEKFEPPESSAFDTFYALHLSDFDFQIDYHIGAEANCSQEVCCIHCGFNEKKAPKNWDYGGLPVSEKYMSSYYNSTYDEEGAFVKGPFVDVFLPTYKGTWDPAHTFGAYKCGTPEVMIDNVLKTVSNFHMREEVDFDFAYVIFNGGFQVRSNNLGETVQSEVKMLQKLKKYFEYTPIITSLGKHDTYPDSQLAQYATRKSKEFSWNEELYGDILLENGWINNDQFRQIKTHNGAYSITTEYGLKIISLNSNFYNSDNYYCFWNSTDIDNFGQFKFLIDELVESEMNDQRVWILSSLPLSSPKAMPFQAKILSNIIERFSPGTIAEVFFGDKHQDGYNILYDKDEVPTAGAWISPSVSPLHGNNPGFRYYEIDSRTFSVLNAFTYYSPLDLTFHNNGDEPKWELLYDTRYTYTHEGGEEEFWPLNAPLNATFWDKVLQERIKNKLNYRQLYQNNKFKSSPYTPVCTEEEYYGICELSYCEFAGFTWEEYKYCIEERYPALQAAAFHPEYKITQQK